MSARAHRGRLRPEDVEECSGKGSTSLAPPCKQGTSAGRRAQSTNRVLSSLRSHAVNPGDPPRPRRTRRVVPARTAPAERSLDCVLDPSPLLPSRGSGREVSASRRCRRATEAGASLRRLDTLAARLYEGGVVCQRGGWCRVVVLAVVVGERRSSLYGLLGGRTRRHWRPAPGAQVQKGRQAARRKAEPPGAGAKGSLLVSMCQIASVSFLATSIWATLAPRWRPRRRLLRW